MKRKISGFFETVGNCEYINDCMLNNEPCTVRHNFKKGDLVWAARKTDGFQFFPAITCDVNPAYPEYVQLTWTDLTQSDIFVKARYVFPRVRVYHRTIRYPKPYKCDKVEEWLLKTSNYLPPSDRTF